MLNQCAKRPRLGMNASVRGERFPNRLNEKAVASKERFPQRLARAARSAASHTQVIGPNASHPDGGLHFICLPSQITMTIVRVRAKVVFVYRELEPNRVHPFRQ